MVWIGNLGSSMVPTTTSSVNIQQIDLCNIIVNNLPKHIMLGGVTHQKGQKIQKCYEERKKHNMAKRGSGQVVVSLVFLKLVQTQINIFIVLLYI